MQKFPYGKIIRNIRNRCELTQEALAMKLRVNKATISAYELEKITPPCDVFYKICSICDTDICFKINDKIYTIEELKRGY